MMEPSLLKNPFKYFAFIKLYQPAADKINMVNAMDNDAGIEAKADAYLECLDCPEMRAFVNSDWYGGSQIYYLVAAIFSIVIKLLKPDKIEGFLIAACTREALFPRPYADQHASRRAQAFEILGARYNRDPDIFKTETRLRIFARLERDISLYRVFCKAAGCMAEFYVDTFKGIDDAVVLPILRGSDAFQRMETDANFRNNLILLGVSDWIAAWN